MIGPDREQSLSAQPQELPKRENPLIEEERTFQERLLLTLGQLYETGRKNPLVVSSFMERNAAGQQGFSFWEDDHDYRVVWSEDRNWGSRWSLDLTRFDARGKGRVLHIKMLVAREDDGQPRVIFDSFSHVILTGFEGEGSSLFLGQKKTERSSSAWQIERKKLVNGGREEIMTYLPGTEFSLPTLMVKSGPKETSDSQMPYPGFLEENFGFMIEAIEKATQLLGKVSFYDNFYPALQEAKKG